MKVLLLGHKGYLGSYLYQYLNCDIATERDGRGTIGSNYDIVINCIAKTDIKWCEEHPLESLRINGNLNLELCNLFPKAKIVSFSTYYVYDTFELATETHPLAINSLNYIKHKIQGEIVSKRGLTFRIGKLFGNPQKQQNRLTEYILNNNPLELDQHRFNPCSCQQILSILLNKSFIMDCHGIFNLANDGITNPVDYAKFILEKAKLSKTILEIERLPFPNYGKFAMNLSKIKQHFSLRPWQEDMEKYLCTV